MKKINIGIIGLGSRLRLGLLNTILSCEEANIVAVCDKYEDRIEYALDKIKEKTGKEAKGYTDYKELLNDDCIEAVIIASSWEHHISMAIESMNAGRITGMEVGGAYDIEECWELVRTYERTKTPIMMLENCCFDEFELLTTSLHRAGKLGEVVHCHGAYRHDLRNEIIGGNVNKHYRLENYKKRNCENYPTHELGPIAKLLDINRGNKMVSLVSVSSKEVGLKLYANSPEAPDKSMTEQVFKQGDIVDTIIKCSDGSTITLTLDTTLPRYYSREFTVNATKGVCSQETNMIMLEDDTNLEEDFLPNKTVRKHLDNAENYAKYKPDIWSNVTAEEKELGHGGMDFFMMKAFLKCAINGEEMPIDVYDAASWMCITALSEVSIACGGMPQQIPDFTCGKWITRKRKDVVEFPNIN